MPVPRRALLQKNKHGMTALQHSYFFISSITDLIYDKSQHTQGMCHVEVNVCSVWCMCGKSCQWGEFAHGHWLQKHELYVGLDIVKETGGGGALCHFFCMF